MFHIMVREILLLRDVTPGERLPHMRYSTVSSSLHVLLVIRST